MKRGVHAQAPKAPHLCEYATRMEVWDEGLAGES